MRKVLSYLLKGITALIFVFTIYIMVFGVIAIKQNKLINIFGYSYGFVPTDSMEGEKPEGSKVKGFKKGSIIFIKTGSFDSLEELDIIIYQSSENVLIVHRIVEKINDGNDIKYITKGDNNSSADIELVSFDNYQGKVIGSMYLLGIGEMFSSFRGTILLIFIFMLIILMFMQLFSIVKRHNENKMKELSEEEIDEIVKERLKGMK